MANFGVLTGAFINTNRDELYRHQVVFVPVCASGECGLNNGSAPGIGTSYADRVANAN